jgi:hypothetical protein
MNIKIRLFAACVLWLFSALPILAQPEVTDSKVDEQYGFRIHTPNSNWVFHEPDNFNVRTLLKPARELIFIRLWTLDTLDEMQDVDLLPPPNALALWRGIPTLSAVADFS